MIIRYLNSTLIIRNLFLANMEMRPIEQSYLFRKQTACNKHNI